MTHLFTYGSLMYPQVWQNIVGQDYLSESAVLNGYIRYGVINEEYPVVLPKAGAQTKGIVYYNVCDADISLLDAFEGAYYQRITLALELTDQSIIDANCYVLKPEYYSICSAQQWSVENFENNGLARFLQQYQGFLSIRD